VKPVFLCPKHAQAARFVAVQLGRATLRALDHTLARQFPRATSVLRAALKLGDVIHG
jgi:hypothetical protein